MKTTKPIPSFFFFSLLAPVLLHLILATPVSAQDDAPAPPAPKNYLIAPTDIVSVYVISMPELSRDYPVSAEGTIELPFLGEIDAKKKTSHELAVRIADGLRPDYLVDPQVSVIVKPTIVTHRYFIQGAVRSPGVYNQEGHPTLLELISVAGGLDATYASTAFIIHKLKQQEVVASESSLAQDGNPPVEYELRKANINALLRGEFAQNLKIEPEDIIQIPPADVFFVAGEVKAPGPFPLKENSTLRQAISLAQGESRTAAPDRGIIFREDATGGKHEIPVDVDAVMHGKNPDIAILANDIIVIPNSKAKSVFLPLVNVFGTSAIYAGTNAIFP